MARKDKSKKEITEGTVSYAIEELHLAEKDFREEENEDSKFSDTYIASRDNSAKTHLATALKILKWTHESQLGQSPVNANTNDEVDAINPDIRTED